MLVEASETYENFTKIRKKEAFCFSVWNFSSSITFQTLSAKLYIKARSKSINEKNWRDFLILSKNDNVMPQVIDVFELHEIKNSNLNKRYYIGFKCIKGTISCFDIFSKIKYKSEDIIVGFNLLCTNIEHHVIALL